MILIRNLESEIDGSVVTPSGFRSHFCKSVKINKGFDTNKQKNKNNDSLLSPVK